MGENEGPCFQSHKSLAFFFFSSLFFFVSLFFSLPFLYFQHNPVSYSSMSNAAHSKQQPAWARPKKQPPRSSVRNKRNNNSSAQAPPQQQHQPVYYCSVLLPETSSRARLLSSRDKYNKIQLADKAAKMEVGIDPPESSFLFPLPTMLYSRLFQAYLKLPKAQSREIFALSDRPRIPFIRLPQQQQQEEQKQEGQHQHQQPTPTPEEPSIEDSANVDSDDTDVEELFLELAHEVLGWLDSFG